MRKTESDKEFPRCSHPALAGFTDALLSAIALNDPLSTARTIADMANRWPDANKRRRALAARIALIGLDSQFETQPELKVTEPVETVSEVVEEVPTVEIDASAEAPKRKSKPKKVAMPKVSLGDAASLLAAIDSSDNSEFSNPEDYSGGMGMSFSGPSDDVFGRAADLSFGPDLGPGQRQERDWSEPEQAMRPWDRTLPAEEEVAKGWDRTLPEEEAPKKQADTATDLSLAILTGEFRRPKAETETVGSIPQEMDIQTTAEPDSVEDQPEPADVAEAPPTRATRKSSSRILADGDLGAIFSESVPPEEVAIDTAQELPAPSKKRSKKSKKAPRIASDISALSALLETDGPTKGPEELIGGRVVADEEASGFVTFDLSDLTKLDEDTPEEPKP